VTKISFFKDAMQYTEKEKEGKQFRIRKPTKEYALEVSIMFLSRSSIKITW
jgi:hypothetical protein